MHSITMQMKSLRWRLFLLFSSSIGSRACVWPGLARPDAPLHTGASMTKSTRARSNHDESLVIGWSAITTPTTSGQHSDRNAIAHATENAVYLFSHISQPQRRQSVHGMHFISMIVSSHFCNIIAMRARVCVRLAANFSSADWILIGLESIMSVMITVDHFIFRNYFDDFISLFLLDFVQLIRSAQPIPFSCCFRCHDSWCNNNHFDNASKCRTKSCEFHCKGTHAMWERRPTDWRPTDTRENRADQEIKCTEHCKRFVELKLSPGNSDRMTLTGPSRTSDAFDAAEFARIEVVSAVVRLSTAH